ncbi:MAG TPA: ABC transporter permease [Gaiellaceae bacterium]|nr:ABC transporter permease [Gaiellaceae bacterium]
MSLAAFALRRVLVTIPLLLLVMLATFALMRGTGGSPFEPPEGYVGVPYQQERVLRRHYRLDEPWFLEFAVYVKNVATLNFGPSLVNRHLTVDDVIRGALPVTLELVLLAAAWAVPVGVALGVWAGVRRGSARDLAATSGATFLLALPVFFVAYLLSTYLVTRWQLVPDGWETNGAKVLPALALGLAPVGYVARLIRTAVVEALQEDYVRTARAKGLRERRVIWVHVLRNSLAPFLAGAVPMIALLVTGAFFVEQAFDIPGASTFFLDAAFTRDYPMLMGLTVVLAVLVLAANLVSDVLLAAADPRVREAQAR